MRAIHGWLVVSTIVGGWIRTELALTTSLALSSCVSETQSFSCEQDGDCGSAGFCEPNGFCSFPDEQCESGRRYGAQGGGAGGLCVPPGGTATHTGGESTSSDSTSSDDTSGSHSGTDSTSGSPTTAVTSNDDTSSGETSPITDGRTTSSSTAPSTDSSTSDASTTEVTGASTTDPSSGETTGPQEVEVEVLADIAECTDPVNNDPDMCETNAGAGNMTVDGQESDSGQATTGWLRFSLGELAGLDIVSVTLEVTVTDDVNAHASTSGEVHEAGAFDLEDLAVAQPIIEDTVVGADQGAVAQGDTVTFDLPVSLVDGSSVLHLALVNSTDGGVNYWNLAGAVPPRLVVTTLQ